MRPIRSLCLLLTLLASALVAAQPDTVAAEEALRRAAAALEGASFHFSYRFWPDTEATSAVTGEGIADLDAQRWHYTVHSDPTDPRADLTADGEWIIVAGSWYHRPSGSAWTTGAPDFTFAGVSAILAPFASYDNLRRLAGDDQDKLDELRWLGRETLGGLEADRYAFATHDLSFYGSSAFEAWLSEDGRGGFERIVLVFTPEGGQPNSVSFSRITEPVEVEAPM